jgi:thiol-disulfide isomerase/thioredoxin
MKREHGRAKSAAPLLSVLFALALAHGDAVAAGGNYSALAPGDSAPALRGYVQPEYRYRDVDWSKNKLTLVNFWAPWCVPCKDEMPRLQQLHVEHGASGLEIIGVYDPGVSAEDILRYIGPVGVTYTLFEPRANVNRLWGGISSLPTSFLVDAQGKVLRRYVGALPEQTEGLARDIEAALEGRPLPPLVMPKANPEAPVHLERR